MNLPNALVQLARNSDLLAVRPRGVAIAITAGLVIIKVGRGKPYRWSPSFADMIADDWSVGTLEQMRDLAGAAAAATE